MRGTIILLLLLGAAVVQAQKPEDDIILKAMKDELNRNMEELILPDMEKPFFIMYGINDLRTYSVGATLGSLIQSNETHQRFRSTARVLVGDYSFNDESFDDNLYSNPTMNDINLPIDDDYFGIRRSFWSVTGNVYRNAAKHFERHKEALKETGKPLADVPHRSFAKSDPVVMYSSVQPGSINLKDMEDKARSLSAVFLQHPQVDKSTVIIVYTEGFKYLVSSEGTVAKIPVSAASIMVMAQNKNAEGEFSNKQFIHLAKSIDKLPQESQLVAETEKLIADIQGISTTPKFTEEYTGPVLIMGPSVANVFSAALFRGGRERIVASDNVPKLTGFQYERDPMSLEGKIGKNICNESITVKLKPALKTFDGLDLLGSFEMDNEGIVPPAELTIVEKGVLKTLLNNRTLTSESQTANGFGNGPGVVEVTLEQKNTDKELKDKLIAEAKKQGLDYAIIIREASTFGFGGIDVYKVSLTDGKEELVRNANLGQVNLKTLKRVLGASSKYKAYNIGGAGFRGADGVTSLIVPESILLEEIDIQPFRTPTLKEEEYVSSPLK